MRPGAHLQDGFFRLGTENARVKVKCEERKDNGFIAYQIWIFNKARTM
jgi:hypothetical protein